MAKSFLFNGAFSSNAGLSFSLDRGYATVDDAGEAVNATAERYCRKPRLLCGAPTITYPMTTNEALGTGPHYIYDAGFSHDSTTPMLVYSRASDGTLRIFRGGLATTDKIYDNSIFQGHASSISKRGQFDLLPLRDANLVYGPRTFAVYHGLVIAFLTVLERMTEDTFTVTSVDPPTSAGVYRVYGSGIPTYLLYEHSFIYFDRAGGYTYAGFKCQGSGYLDVELIGGAAPGAGDTVRMPRWRPFSTALAQWQNATTGWQYVGVGPRTQEGHPRGAALQSQGFRTFETGPVKKGWLAFSDYVYNVGVSGGFPALYSFGGIYFLLHVSRGDMGEEWTVHTLAPVLELSTTSQSTHAHCPYVERFGTSGLRMVCPVGDSQPNNRVIILYRSDESYTAAASTTADATQNGWTTREDRNGTHGQTTGAAYGEGNQFVGTGPLGYPGTSNGHVVGSDEMGIPLVKLRRLTGTSTTGLADFIHAYGQPPASPNHSTVNENRQFNWQVFTQKCSEPNLGWNHFAAMAPGNAKLNIASARILYSPNGEVWGECFAHHMGTDPFGLFGNTVVLGASGDYKLGVRSIPFPYYTTQRPLQIGREGQSLLINVGSSQISTPSAGFSVSVLSSLPTGVPKPPCSGAIIRCQAVSPTTATERDLGTWTVTGATVPNPSTSGCRILVRMWLYPMGASAGGQANAFGARVAIGNASDVSIARESFVLAALQAAGDLDGGWVPLTLDTTTTEWLTDDGNPATTPGSPFAVALRWAALWPANLTPTDFLVALDYVYCDTSSTSPGAAVEHPGISLPPGVTTARACESAFIAGFTCGTSWTAQLGGEFSVDAADSSLTKFRLGIDRRVMASLVAASGKAVTIHADVANRRIVFRVPSGSSYNEVSVGPDYATTGEEFWFGRGSGALISVVATKLTTGTRYTCYASIGHTTTYFDSVDGDDLSPTQIKFSDASGNNPECMLWWGGNIEEDTALSTTQVKTSFRTLGMLYIIGNYVRPDYVPPDYEYI